MYRTDKPCQVYKYKLVILMLVLYHSPHHIHRLYNYQLGEDHLDCFYFNECFNVIILRETLSSLEIQQYEEIAGYRYHVI